MVIIRVITIIIIIIVFQKPNIVHNGNQTATKSHYFVQHIKLNSIESQFSVLPESFQTGFQKTNIVHNGIQTDTRSHYFVQHIKLNSTESQFSVLPESFQTGFQKTNICTERNSDGYEIALLCSTHQVEQH